MPMMEYNQQELDRAYEISTVLLETIKETEQIVDNDKVQFDDRIIEYYNEQFSNIDKIDLVDDIRKTSDFVNWLSEKLTDLKKTIEENNNKDIGADLGGGSGNYGSNANTVGISQRTVDEHNIGELPSIKPTDAITSSDIAVDPANQDSLSEGADATTSSDIAVDSANQDGNPGGEDGSTTSTTDLSSSPIDSTASSGNNANSANLSYGATSAYQSGRSHANNAMSGDKSKDGLKGASSSANEIGKDVLKAIKNGASFLSNKFGGINPGVATAKIINTKGANAAVLAAASLAAGASAAGGGIMLGKKLKQIIFTPKDWASLSEDNQTTIEALMLNIGFSTEEVELLKNSTFKISADELKTHSKKISNIVNDSEEIEESLNAQYGYEMVDSSGNVNNYLLFITMIIDGKGIDDNYNFYNVINMGIDPDEADFSYTGIQMKDYIVDDKNKEDKVDEQSDSSSKEINDDIALAKSAAIAIKNMGSEGFDSNSDANDKY